MSTARQHLVVMGVSGAGKSTVARAVADRLAWPFGEGDDFHPASNVAAMAAGVPLTDEDRRPWLQAIRAWVTEQEQAGRPSVVACSALRRGYRDVLRDGPGRVRFVHVTAPADELGRRLATRTGHFMPAGLLLSQLDTLEPLEPDEDGVTVEALDGPARAAQDALRALGLAG